MASQTESPKSKIAVSLEYDGDTAPKVTAKGRGYIAQEIIDCAKQHNIPIQKDQQLVSLLAEVELNEEIPEKLYEAVAQILVFAYEISGKTIPTNPKK
jgi:flagellar biosynthesis protein